MENVIRLILTKLNINEKAQNELLQKLTNPKNIFDFLINRKIIDEATLLKAIALLLREGKISIEDLDQFDESIRERILRAYAAILNTKYIDLDGVEIDFNLASKLPINQIKRYMVLPIAEDDLSLSVAMADPLDIGAKEIIQRSFPNKNIKFYLADRKQINKYLSKIELSENIKEYVEEIRKDLQSGVTNRDAIEESSAVLKLIETILKTSIMSKASDIHIEPTEKNCVVRARKDGILNELFALDKDVYPPLASRLKLLANLDITEKRKPQDGRFSGNIMGKEFDFRISTLPIVTGESIVIRILDKTKALIPLQSAGMSRYNYEIFTKALKVPHGIILVTGPTGSGKSTTLYGALNMLRSVEKKIITVEDPVEYQISMVQQSQVNPKIGFTFATALRSILRQDPDIIMVGEIRDQETMRIAIQAAMTGHLVLSTLHTNDSISAVNRIIDMGIEPYLVSGSLVAVEAQRLVRKVCPACKKEVELPSSVLQEIAPYLPKNYRFFKGEGCKNCNFTGYDGREMISEVLYVDDEISRLISKEAPKEKIEEVAIKKGFKPMLVDGINKAIEGATTIEEVLRVTRL
ncbi:MAG: Flp pilus assembly complex ATPase component [Epsilonproteobacteria bacterium]|nr:Flp pilus assembly complex ATPase component [Campylobacterota bacterium]